MKQRLLYILLLVPLLSLAAPRLTVIVVVDGLNTDNLTRLRPYWPQGGLRTLSEEAYQTTVTFPHRIYGGSEAVATLMTGATPSVHGYAMDTYFGRSDRKAHPMLEDATEKGIGSALRLSPRSLLAPTMTDEWRMREGEKAKIYAIGIHPRTAILMAGHSADACVWLEPDGWAASSFYSEGLPGVADRMNVGGRFAELMAREWTPRMDINAYMRPTDTEKKKSFSYSMSGNYDRCPVTNTLVIELALALQEKEKMGQDIIGDMLLLELTTRSPKAQADIIETAEQEDMYLWLNQDLGYLMEQLDKRIGKTNYQVLLVGTPALGSGSELPAMAGMPRQQFNIDHAAALTGTYLMAIYGHERWVDGGYGQSIYLNRTLIEQKRLSIETMERQVADFLLEFEGVRMAYPRHEAFVAPQLSGALNKRSVGDVVFTLEEGWQLKANDRTVLDYVVDANARIPVMLWSGTLRSFPEQIKDATEVRKLIE